MAAYRQRYYEKRYDVILTKGFAINPIRTTPSGKRGRIRQSDAYNLLMRLQKHKRETLAFMYNPLIPFDNNQGERDIRMTKLKQKISGHFRSELGATIFCRIRGYISTVRKNNLNVLESIQAALENKPFLVPLPN